MPKNAVTGPNAKALIVAKAYYEIMDEQISSIAQRLGISVHKVKEIIKEEKWKRNRYKDYIDRYIQSYISIESARQRLEKNIYDISPLEKKLIIQKVQSDLNLITEAEKAKFKKQLYEIGNKVLSSVTTTKEWSQIAIAASKLEPQIIPQNNVTVTQQVLQSQSQSQSVKTPKQAMQELIRQIPSIDSNTTDQ